MPDPSFVDLGKKPFNPEELNSPSPVVDPAPADPTPPVTPPEDNKGNNPPQDKYTPRETQLYTRAKTAEQQLKEYREKYGDLAGNPPATPPSNSTDPFDLAKTVASLKDYDARELDFASMVAKAKGIRPEEAVQTEDFKIFLSGKRALDLKNNSIPRPNSSAPSSNVKTADEIAQMTDAEFAAYERDFRSKQQGGGI